MCGMRRSRWLSPLALVAALVALGSGGTQANAQPRNTTAAHETVGVSSTRWRVARLEGIPVHRGWTYFLSAVACPTRDSCFLAGGDWSPDGTSTSIVEHFDGHDWSRIHVGASSDTFNAVSCASPSYCMIVGSNAANLPLAVLYDAGRWTRDVVQHTNNELDAVSCPGAGTCIVAGSPTGISHHPVMSWEYDHGSWRWLPVNLRLQALYNVAGISCENAKQCELFGGYSFGGPGGGGFIERFEGTLWRSDELQTESRGGFDSVSCSRSGVCVATEALPWATDDSSGLSGFVAQERERGRWKFVGRGLPRADQLVVAPAGSQCFKVGWCVVTAASNTGLFVSTVEDGRLRPLAVVRGIRLPASNPWLEGLSCATPAFCVQGSESTDAPYVLVGDAL